MYFHTVVHRLTHSILDYKLPKYTNNNLTLYNPKTFIRGIIFEKLGSSYSQRPYMLGVTVAHLIKCRPKIQFM